MKRKRRNKLILYIVMTFFFIMSASGCDKYARHKVLTFFFTGVPPVDSEELQSESSRRQGLSIEERREAKRIEAIQAMEDQKIASWAHGPFAAGQCHLCHSTASSATFRSPVKQSSGTEGKQKGGVSLRLIMEDNKLCIDCHLTKSVDIAYGKGLWVHGPVSRGICTACHSPHQSPYQYMLLEGDSKEMCAKCHAKGFIMETQDHLKDEQCTSCHNPHVGKSRFLLKKDYDENL